MVKKTLNLSDLEKTLKVGDGITTNLKATHLAINHKTLPNLDNKNTTNVVFTHVDLDNSVISEKIPKDILWDEDHPHKNPHKKFHKLFVSFYAPKIDTISNLRIRILDMNLNILSDSISQLKEIVVTQLLSFYTENPSIRLELCPLPLSSNSSNCSNSSDCSNSDSSDSRTSSTYPSNHQTYHLTKIQHESFTHDEVLALFPIQDLGKDQGKDQIKDLQHLLSSYIRPWSLNFQKEKTGYGYIMALHKQLFLLNCGNLFVKILSNNSDGKSGGIFNAPADFSSVRNSTETLEYEMKEKDKIKEKEAILIWSLQIEDHYKNALFTPDLLTIYPTGGSYRQDLQGTSLSLASSNDYTSIIESIKHDYDSLNEKIQELSQDEQNHNRNIAIALRIRSTQISDIKTLEDELLELLREEDLTLNDLLTDDTQNRSVGAELREKKAVLGNLRTHLMKELHKQNNCKRVSDIILRQIAKSDDFTLADDNLFIETIKNYRIQIINLINAIGTDITKIDEESNRISHILPSSISKNNNNNNNSDDIEILKSENKKETDLLKSQIEEITSKINDTNIKVSEIRRKIALLKIRKASVFYSLLENLLETRLSEIYRS